MVNKVDYCYREYDFKCVEMFMVFTRVAIGSLFVLALNLNFCLRMIVRDSEYCNGLAFQ